MCSLMKPMPLAQRTELAGYIQISLDADGKLTLRGSRALVDWLLAELAAEGWILDLDSLSWCG